MNCILVVVAKDLVWESEESVFDSGEDQVENDGDIGERRPLLNTLRRCSHSSVVRPSQLPKTKTSPQPKKGSGDLSRGKAGEPDGACLVQERKVPKKEVSKSLNLKQLSCRSYVSVWIKGNRRRFFHISVQCLAFPYHPSIPIVVQHPTFSVRLRLRLASGPQDHCDLLGHKVPHLGAAVTVPAVV